MGASSLQAIERDALDVDHADLDALTDLADRATTGGSELESFSTDLEMHGGELS